MLLDGAYHRAAFILQFGFGELGYLISNFAVCVVGSRLQLRRFTLNTLNLPPTVSLRYANFEGRHCFRRMHFEKVGEVSESLGFCNNIVVFVIKP